MITTGIVIKRSGFGRMGISLGALAAIPANEFSMMKTVVVAAEFLGSAIPPRISRGAKYTPPPMPVAPATIPIMVPKRIFRVTPSLMVRKGDVAIMIASPPPAIEVPMIIFSTCSGNISEPLKKAAGTEPTMNHSRSFDTCILHLVKELIVEKILKI